jgi:citrate lyase subunit beta / citryl-CoA lyase
MEPDMSAPLIAASNTGKSSMIRPRRSALYMPGFNARALEKARTLPADVLILDLEDAVAPESKDIARRQVHAAVTAGGYGPREIVIRVNAAGTPWFEEDLAVAISAAPDAILIPKVGDPGDLASVGKRLTQAAAPERTRVWAMMETPLGMLNAAQIARANVDHPESRLAVLVLGTNDLAKETRAEIVPERWTMLPWLMTCVAAARAYGLEVLDGAYNNFRDESGLRREAEQGKEMGMDGKTVIHPDQVVPVNQIFSPSPADVASAQRIMEAFEKPENKGRGVITVDGRMVELLHAEMAARTVAIAKAIAKHAGD